MPRSTAKPRAQRGTKPIRKTRATKATEPALRATLPGQMSFTREVWTTVWGYRQLFWKLALIAWLGLILGSLTAEQTQYTSLSEATHEAVKGVSDSGSRVLIATGILFSSLLTGSLTSVLSEGQHAYRTAIYLLLWLVTVWLLRHLLGGSKVKVRDGLYNAGAPLIPTLLIVLVGIVQLLPLALAVSLFAGLVNTGALNQVIVTVVMGAVSVALAVATLYWLSGTFFAAIVATIPGTYPVAALRSARSVIAGYRVSVLIRLLWLSLVLFVAFAVMTLPFLYADAALGVTIPVLVVMLSQLLSVVGVIYASAYIYLLYRKIIDGRAG